MKPTLTKALLAMVLAFAAAPLVQADYAGVQILNQDDTYTGDITINYNHDSDEWFGAVQRTGDAGSNGTTILEGNIAITAGYDFRDNTTDTRRNSAVLIGNENGTDEETSIGATNATIILRTVNADDQIIIDSYAKGARTILSCANKDDTDSVKIIINASASTSKDIIINQHNTGIGGNGLSTAGKGILEVTGNVRMSLAAEHAYGINLDGQTSNVAGLTNMVITGNTSISATGANSIGVLSDNSKGVFNGALNVNGVRYGIRATNGSDISVTGNTVINASNADSAADGLGLYVTSGSNVTLSGKLAANVTGVNTYGVHASNSNIVLEGYTTLQAGKNGIDAYDGSTVTAKDRVNILVTGEASNGYSAGVQGNVNSTVYLSGADRIEQQGTGSDHWAIKATAGGVVTDFGGAAHQYKVKGNMTAHANGSTIDLKMNGLSFFNGKTALTGTGSAINLAFEDDSLWQVTGNSQLTNLTLGQGSALQLAFNGSSLTDIISATDAITLESGSYIYLTGNLSSLKDDNTFDFFSGTLVNNGVKFVGFDGSDWLEYEYTQTGANTFRFSGITQTLADEPAFIEAIPEPATATLGLLGLASLLIRRRKA